MSAVSRGDALSSTASHQAPGATNVSTEYATRTSPARTISSIAHTGGRWIGGSGVPSNSKARRQETPPSISSTQSRAFVAARASIASVDSGTISLASAMVAAVRSATRRMRPFGASFRERTKSSSPPKTASTARSSIDASFHHDPSSCARTNTSHSPPSPRWTLSMTHRPSGEDDTTFSAIRSSANTPARSGWSSVAPSS